MSRHQEVKSTSTAAPLTRGELRELLDECKYTSAGRQLVICTCLDTLPSTTTMRVESGPYDDSRSVITDLGSIEKSRGCKLHAEDESPNRLGLHPQMLWYLGTVANAVFKNHLLEELDEETARTFIQYALRSSVWNTECTDEPAFLKDLNNSKPCLCKESRELDWAYKVGDSMGEVYQVRYDFRPQPSSDQEHPPSGLKFVIRGHLHARRQATEEDT